MTTLIDDVTVIGGVDTHKHTHYAAAIDDHGRLLGHQQFPATSPGYEALRSWMHGLGNLASIGVESTGSFGAALSRELTRQGEHVIEVNRPNRIARRMDGKSEPRRRANRPRRSRGNVHRHPKKQIRDHRSHPNPARHPLQRR